MPPMQKPITLTTGALVQVGRGHEIAQEALVAEGADRGEPFLEGHVLPLRPWLDRTDRPPGAGGQIGDHVVEQGPQPADVGDDDQATGRVGDGDQLGGGTGGQGGAHRPQSRADAQL